VVVQERLDLAAEGTHLVLVQHYFFGQAVELRGQGIGIRWWGSGGGSLDDGCLGMGHEALRTETIGSGNGGQADGSERGGRQVGSERSLGNHGLENCPV
jgi:hypothetical protein